jgi:hypothetical protein
MTRCSCIYAYGLCVDSLTLDGHIHTYTTLYPHIRECMCIYVYLKKYACGHEVNTALHHELCGHIYTIVCTHVYLNRMHDAVQIRF